MPTIVAVAASRFCIAVTFSTPEDRLVGEHRAQGVETGRARTDDDVHRDRTVRSELDRPLVGHAGHQRRLLSRSGRGYDQGEKPSDEECAQHDPE